MGNDSFTEVTSQSWFSRLGNAFKGIIVGIILVGAAFFLLFWNEGRAVKRYKTLKEGGGAVVSVSAETVDPANQGKLVHLSGMADTQETLVDQEFGVSARAIKLQREVEMYQWQQESHSEEKKKLGGGTETVTTYTYRTAWSSQLIDSDSFKKQEGHRNPAVMPFNAEEQIASMVTVGGFSLSPSLKARLRNYSPVSLGPDYTLPIHLQGKAQVTAGIIYMGEDAATPRVGDVRISFSKVTPLNVSIVARQVGNSFTPYQAEAGGTIELLESGIVSADAMFAQAQKSNTILTWVIRVGGFFLMFIGFQLIFGPLSVLADVIPLLGTIVGAGTGIVAGLVAGIFSFLTIAVAWFVYRPLLSLILLAIAGGVGYLLFTKLRKASPPVGGESPGSSAPPPPPPPPGS